MKQGESNPISIFLGEHPLMKWVAIVLIAFPWLISLVQYFARGYILPMSAGDMVQYYGTIGALFWTVGAFALQGDEQKTERAKEERRRAAQYIPNFALEARSEGEAIRFTVINIGAHGVRDLHLEDQFLTSYLASEKDCELLAMTRSPRIESLALQLDMNHKADDELVWGVSFSGDIHPDSFPEEISLYACDLLDRSWRQTFVRSSSGESHMYVAKQPVDAES